MHQLHVEGREPEHHGGWHIGKVQAGERGDGEEHSGGHVGGGRVQRIDMRHDDAAVTASDTQHDESRQADAGDEHGLQAGNKAGENGMQERTQRGK